MKPSLVVVGLGNPGAQYTRTRHNLGFRAVDALSAAFGTGEWQDKQKFQCRAQEARIVTIPVLLVQPATYMNRSGECIRKLIDFYKLDAQHQVLVICDDLDVELGEVRFRLKGGPGTHNGLRSVVEQIGEGFPRMRIGLGRPDGEIDLAAWVLSVPPPEEEQQLAAVIDSTPAKVREYVLERPESQD